ncbi:diguanylate cyclase [Jiella sp. M17.18]|uniref:sensor domain-containing diguanylate cyclase n=1 Tax=Jiella sp. M17.18 TaxID=3234247 RepID=UPI0034E042F9
MPTLPPLACAEPPARVRLLWQSGDGAAVPAALKAQGVRCGHDRDEQDLPTVVFAPPDVAASGAPRGSAGKAAYVVVVLPADPALAVDSPSDLLDTGADDVLDLADPAAVEFCVARAARTAARIWQAELRADRLRRDRDSLQAGIDNLPSPIFFKNSRGIYTGCNKAFEAFIGHPADKIVGSSVYGIAPCSLAKVYHEADTALMATGGTQIYEADVRYADGERHNVMFHKCTIEDERGRTVGLAGAMLDITERKQLEARLRHAAERDPLTKAYNRRKFLELAELTIARERAAGRPVGVAVCDIDHFKRINDRFGHACGDDVICRLVEVMQREIGSGNLLARAGGEEFFCLFPGLPLAEAAARAERLRQSLADERLGPDGTSLAVTASFGVAELARSGESLLAAIARADNALYCAKRSGRDRVCLADHPAAAPAAATSPVAAPGAESVRQECLTAAV